MESYAFADRENSIQLDRESPANYDPQELPFPRRRINLEFFPTADSQMSTKEFENIANVKAYQWMSEHGVGIDNLDWESAASGQGPEVFSKVHYSRPVTGPRKSREDAAFFFALKRPNGVLWAVVYMSEDEMDRFQPELVGILNSIKFSNRAASLF